MLFGNKEHFCVGKVLESFSILDLPSLHIPVQSKSYTLWERSLVLVMLLLTGRAGGGET